MEHKLINIGGKTKIAFEGNVVYRNLAKGELSQIVATDRIRAKDESGSRILANFIRKGTGCKKKKYPFIATTKSVDVLRAWAESTKDTVAVIDLDELKNSSSECIIYDVSTYIKAMRLFNEQLASGIDKRERNQGTISFFNQAAYYAQKSEEVDIFIPGGIPSTAFRLVEISLLY